MSQVFRKKNKLKLLKFEEIFDFTLKSLVRQGPKNSIKVVIQKYEIAECFRHIAVNFCKPIRAEAAHMCHVYCKISRKFSFEDISVMFVGDCFYMYWLEFLQVR
jgi:hypothetical protein